MPKLQPYVLPLLSPQNTGMIGERKFCQTFVLEEVTHEGEKFYLIHNDIFRFIQAATTSDSDAAAAPENNADTTAVPAAEVAPAVAAEPAAAPAEAAAPAAAPPAAEEAPAAAPEPVLAEEPEATPAPDATNATKNAAEATAAKATKPAKGGPSAAAAAAPAKVPAPGKPAAATATAAKAGAPAPAPAPEKSAVPAKPVKKTWATMTAAHKPAAARPPPQAQEKPAAVRPQPQRQPAKAVAAKAAPAPEPAPIPAPASDSDWQQSGNSRAQKQHRGDRAGEGGNRSRGNCPHPERQGCSLYVRQLPSDCNNKMLYETFKVAGEIRDQKPYGPCINIQQMKNPPKEPHAHLSHYAFVEFKQKASLQFCLARENRDKFSIETPTVGVTTLKIEEREYKESGGKGGPRGGGASGSRRGGGSGGRGGAGGRGNGGGRGAAGVGGRGARGGMR